MGIHHHLSLTMTFQPTIQTHDNDDKADEASSLLLTVAEGGVPARTKKNSIPMRAMIATCFLLGTIAVIYFGESGSSNTSSDGISAVLVRGHNQAATMSVYDPSQDYIVLRTKKMPTNTAGSRLIGIRAGIGTE